MNDQIIGRIGSNTIANPGKADLRRTKTNVDNRRKTPAEKRKEMWNAKGMTEATLIVMI